MASNSIHIWVEEHSDYLFNFAMSKVSDRDLSFDFVQETFLAAIKAEDSFEGRSSARTWLTSILNRKIIDYWRKQSSRKTQPVSHFVTEGSKTGDWVLENAPQGSIEAYDAQLEKEETNGEVYDCISKLPMNWKGIISAKYFEDKKGEEICEEFDITPSNFWVIVHRAKVVMRDCLEKKWA